MAVDQDTRTEFQARRDAGLRARHAWRLEQARIREQQRQQQRQAAEK